MKPQVEFQDRSEYKDRMNALLAIDPRRTVVLTVDMQRDYLDLEIGAAPVAADDAERVLKHSRDLLDFARAEGLPVVHVYARQGQPLDGARADGPEHRVGAHRREVQGENPHRSRGRTVSGRSALLVLGPDQEPVSWVGEAEGPRRRRSGGASHPRRITRS